VNQASHIFAKDLRRLWPQVLVVSGLFILYGMTPPDRGGAGITALMEHGNSLAALVAIACWTLGANLVHEDGMAEESPFWLTRPYNRAGLLTAKVLFLFAFVFLPLVASGVLREARAGVSVTANLGTLIVLDLGVATWLILPALAIGAVSRNLTSFAAGVTSLAFAYYMVGRWFRWSMRTEDLALRSLVPDGPNIAAVLPMILAAIAVTGIQYAARKTRWSQVALTMAVIGSAFMMHLNGVELLSARVVNPPGFDLNRVRISFDETVPPRVAPEVDRTLRGPCPAMALKVDGLPRGMMLRQSQPVQGQADSPLAGIRDIDKATLEQTAEGYREYVCVPGPFTNARETIRLSPNFAVVAVETVATFPARRGSFVAGNAGRCEILVPFPENTQVRCDLEEPLIGSYSAGLEYPGYGVYSASFFPSNGPVRMSPVSLAKFDGVSFDRPGGWPFEEAFVRQDARFVLRTERVVGYLQRDLVYHDFVHPWQYPLLRPIPPPPGRKK